MCTATERLTKIRDLLKDVKNRMKLIHIRQMPVLSFLYLMIACGENETELANDNDSEVSAKKAESTVVEDLYYIVDE